MIDQLTDYLEREADKVHVHDTLADIERGVVRVPIAARAPRRSWVASALVGSAAAAVALFGLAALDRPGEAPVADGVALPAAAPVEPASPDVTTVAPAQVWIPLPDGATMQGLTPTCTTLDGIEFDCVVEGYRTAGAYGDGGIDHTDEAQAVITAGSVVSGGCRSTSADGSTWHCALGQRAVDLGIIGQSFLGATSPPGYAYG